MLKIMTALSGIKRVQATNRLFSRLPITVV